MHITICIFYTVVVQCLYYCIKKPFKANSNPFSEFNNLVFRQKCSNSRNIPVCGSMETYLKHRNTHSQGVHCYHQPAAPHAAV